MKGDFSLLVALARSRHPILVVGGGMVGERKIQTLLDAKCTVHLVSPDITELLGTLVLDGRVHWTQRFARADDFRDHRFAVLALSESATRPLLETARREKCLLNCVSLPDESDWAFCAQFSHEQYRFGIGTCGSSPAAAAAMKRRIASFLRKEEEEEQP